MCLALWVRNTTVLESGSVSNVCVGLWLPCASTHKCAPLDRHMHIRTCGYISMHRYAQFSIFKKKGKELGDKTHQTVLPMSTFKPLVRWEFPSSTFVILLPSSQPMAIKYFPRRWASPTCLVLVIKHPDKSNLPEKVFMLAHSSRTQWGSRAAGPKPSGHIVHAVREQKQIIHVQSPPAVIFGPGPKPIHRIVLPTVITGSSYQS